MQEPSLPLSEPNEAPHDSLVPVHQQRLQIMQLAGDSTLQQFCNKHGLDLDKDEVFLELDTSKGDLYQDIFDVVLMEQAKVSHLSIHIWRVLVSSDCYIYQSLL